MSRGFYDFVLRLIKRLESLLVKGTIVLIILLITVQVALNDPLNAELDFKQLPFVEKVMTYLELNEKQYNQANSKPASQSVLEVGQGAIELKVLNLNKQVRSQVKVLVNGQLKGNFSKGHIRFTVQNGDEIILDTRGINKGAWFKVIDLSNNMRSYQEGEQFWIKNDLRSLGKVELKKRY